MSTPSVSRLVRSAAQRLVALIGPLAERLDRGGVAGESAYQLVSNAVRQCLVQLDTLGLRGKDNQLPSSELWNIAGHLLERGWLQTRARMKPRGYAGDYEMLARMYENECCDDPLGALFDRYFQEEAAPGAVRNRMRMIAAWIVERATASGKRPQEANAPRSPSDAPRSPADSSRLPLKIAVVGSAFGLEVRDALRALDEQTRCRISVTLLDLDPAALDFARQQIGQLLAPERLTTVSANLFRLPQRQAIAQHLEGTDLLFCPGIFDYLDDAAAAEMLGAFWQRLAPRGRMWVFQFAPHNSSRSFMEWLGNWYLIYRDEAAFRQIVADSGIPAGVCQFGAEALGVDLVVTASRA